MGDSSRPAFYVYLGLVLVVLIFVVRPQRVAKEFRHNEAESKKSEATLKRFRDKLYVDPPVGLILVGNSMLNSRIKKNICPRYVKGRCLFYGVGGSASSSWFLFVKNVLSDPAAKGLPVLVFFRDNDFSRPAFRIGGIRRSRIKTLMTEDETDFFQVIGANSSRLRSPDEIIRSTRGLKNLRDAGWKRLDQGGARFARLADDADETVQLKTFNKRLHYSRFRASVADMSEDVFGADHQPEWNKTFLPYIFDVARANQLKLVLFRVQRRSFVEGSAQTELMADYIKGLREYVHSEGHRLIDEYEHPRVPLEWMGDGDHIHPSKIEDYSHYFFRTFGEEIL